MKYTEEYLIIFEDLIGSTELARTLENKIFAEKYISSFHWSANRALDYICDQNVFQNLNQRIAVQQMRIAGDEALCFQELKGSEQDSTIASAVAHAFMTQLYWLVSPYNLRRLEDKKPSQELAIGIEKGPAAKILTSKSGDIAGYHVNKAKMIEGAARQIRSGSRILAAKEIGELFSEWKAKIKEEEIGGDVTWPPLLHADFREVKNRIQVKGEQLEGLVELYFPAASKSLEAFMNNIQSFLENKKSYDLASNPWRTFLSMGEHLFKDDVPFLLDSEGAESIMASLEKKYIDKWFVNVSNVRIIFPNNNWINIMSIFVSMSLIMILRSKGHMDYEEHAATTLAQLSSFPNDLVQDY